MQLNDDLIIFEDEKTKIIFHPNTFFQLLKGIIIKYVKKNELEAENLILNHYYYKDYILNRNSCNAYLLLDHDSLFHYAMIIVYGENYWVDKPQLLTISTEQYSCWEKEFIESNNLKSNYIEHII
jgi:hypothetical protein